MIVAQLHAVLGNVNQLDGVGDAQTQGLAVLDANNAAGLFGNSGVDHVDDLLGLAGTGLTQNNFNHITIPPIR